MIPLLYAQLQELAQSSSLTTDLVRHWFTTKASLQQTAAASAAAHTTGTRPVAPGVAAEPPTTGSSPPESQAGGGMEEKTEASVCSVASEAEDANADETVNATKGNIHQRERKLSLQGLTKYPDLSN